MSFGSANLPVSYLCFDSVRINDGSVVAHVSSKETLATRMSEEPLLLSELKQRKRKNRSVHDEYSADPQWLTQLILGKELKETGIFYITLGRQPYFSQVGRGSATFLLPPQQALPLPKVFPH